MIGNLTAGDLRRVSIFDEIETLDNVPFEGKDTNLKTRNKSALAVILRGSDDSEMLLPPSTKELNVAKGHVEAINEQITSLLADVPQGLTLLDVQEGLSSLTKADVLKVRLAEMKEKSKRKKQVVERDISDSATALCTRVKALLDDWGVPGVDSIYFDDGVSDWTSPVLLDDFQLPICNFSNSIGLS
jgi:hypothetical protein